MAKTIKFNLIIDKQPIRDLEDLQNHFNIEDLLGAFYNGSLKRWLEARGLAAELEKLVAISGDADDGKIAVELCKIFQEDCTKEQITSAMYPFEFRKKDEEKLRSFGDLKNKKAEIILHYHAEYYALLNQMKENPGDYPFIKAAIQKIFESYLGLFKLDAKAFYDRFVTDCRLVILTILANCNMRPLLPHDLAKVYTDVGTNVSSLIPATVYNVTAFLEKWKRDNNQPEVRMCTSSDQNKALKKQKKNICVLKCNEGGVTEGTIINSEDIYNWFPFSYVDCADLPILSSEHPSQVKSFAGVTEGYWKDVEPKGKQFLIIKMEDGNIIRNSGKNGEELKAQDINAQFLILDGIDYKSNNASHQLIYMEI